MKTRLRKLLSMLLAVTMLLSVCSITTFAADPESLPTALPAPDGIILYDRGAYNTELAVKISSPEEILDVYEKGYVNRVSASGTYGYTSDYGEWYLAYDIGIQLDWKIDDGEWQYTSDWDTEYYDWSSEVYRPYASYGGERVSEISVGYASSYDYYSGIVETLNELGYLLVNGDGATNYYRMDTENHSVSVRARYFFTFYGADSASTIVLSPWSETATYGGGPASTSAAPSALSAPDIRNLEIYDIDEYDGYPQARFDLYAESDVLEALMWSEQYDADMDYSEIVLEVETSLDPGFGEGSTVHKRTFSQSSILDRRVTYNDLFFDLWYDLPTSDHEAFVWNGETIYLRARWVNERRVNTEWSEIQSPYSEVVSVEGPTITSYSIDITHGTYGFDSESYASESYRITEGCELETVYCTPMEGCYVDTVTVDGVTMYSYGDETTYELLDWNSSYTYFEFLGEADYASKDLSIEITYAGTPTAQYGITTVYGEGGDLYIYSSYVSWSDDSLVVYHGSTPKIYIYPDNGHVIDTVLIDGVPNEQAKADGYYTFPEITDSSHSIEVTFRREAYRVDHWAGSNGTISTDYEWWNGQTDYVKIGDDITFTFAPNSDGNGNYYEITNVYIDYVVNEAAKSAQTYTFENVQANHSIDVYFSSDPVVTHDVTATAGENGRISPEGVVHVREGSNQRFEFLPDEGYELDQVFVDGVEITNLASTEYYYVADVTEDRTIHVTFRKMPVYHNVTVLVSGQNTDAHTVSPRGVTPVPEGGSFSVTFAPFAGYEVEKVLVDGAPVSAEGSYSIASVNAPATIEIFFKISSYTVTFVDHDGTVLKTETVAHGEQATAPADPVREHYVFTGWDTNFSEVTTAVTIRATYKPAEYTVKFLGWDGTVLKTETVTYSESATAPEAPAREGYGFSHWSHAFTNVSSDLTVTAVYTQKEYLVTFVDSDDTVLSTQTVKHGEAATAPANPTKEGYTFVGWDNTGYGCVTSAMNIKAMYVEGTGVTYTITARALGSGGTVSPIGATTVQENASLVLNFTADSLSKIVKVVVDGSEISLCDSYTFENITANHTIDVYFAPTAVINVESSNSRQGTASGHYELIDGEMVYVLDITPARGYKLDGIYIDGELVDLEVIGGQYIIRDLSEDMDIDVRFKRTSSGGGGGGGSGSGSYYPDVSGHTCTSRCEVCGGCTDVDCTDGACAAKCRLLGMNFTDVADGKWYTESVAYVYHHGMMEGISNDRFDINGTTTRAMIVTILWRLEGKPAVGDPMSFDDVAAGMWYTEAVRWAHRAGIVEGYSNGKFGPNDPITREQLAAILWRYAKYKGYDVSVGERTNLLGYEDASEISQYAIPAMQWACGSGLMEGDGVKLTPKTAATRAQAAALFQRFRESLARS